MSKILVYGEGPHEIGRSHFSKRTGSWVTTDGWLQPMVRALRSSAGTVEGRSLQSIVQLPGKANKTPHLSNLGKKALAAMLTAAGNNFSAVVFATDADTVVPNDRSAKVTEIEAGFAAYPGPVVGIAAVPMGMSEAWLLADPAAWAVIGATDYTHLPSHPELTWGAKDNPQSNRPKYVFARMCEANDIDDHSGTRRDIAEQSDFATVGQACPISFPPFATALSAV